MDLAEYTLVYNPMGLLELVRLSLHHLHEGPFECCYEFGPLKPIEKL